MEAWTAWPPLLAQAGLGIGDAPVKGRPPERLRQDDDATELAIVEPALLLHRLEELLVIEVPVAEVVAYAPWPSVM